MAASTIFKNFATPVENVSLIILSNWIASDKYKAQVEEIRDMIAQGNAEEAQKKKQQLQPSLRRQLLRRKDYCQTWRTTAALYTLTLTS